MTEFQRKLAERRAAQEAARKAAAPPVPPTGYDDLVPAEEYTRSDEDKALDRVIENIDIIDAYRRWCGKSAVDPKGKREGIKISCPTPGHADKNPSAWINLDKQTWFCAACEVGGDAHDIAAYHFGFPVPGYKDGAQFHELRRKMAESYGYTFVSAPGLTSKVMVAPEPEPEPEATYTPTVKALEEDTSKGTDAEIISLYDDDDDEIIMPTLDWHSIVPPNTFLDDYMRICMADDVPEEYHFWNGLLAIGFAIGRDVTLADRIPVMGNLFICLLGNTGDGKSRSFSHLRALLRAALPYKWDDPATKGTQIISNPASAEVLVHSFSRPVEDPVNPKVVAYYAPVRGLVEYNELSALTSRTARMGNALKPTLMEMYDASGIIATSSMTSGKKEAHDPFCSVFTTTQPKALKQLVKMSDADSGFLNRWVFASGATKERIAIGGEIIDISPAVPALQSIQGWAGFGKRVNWSTEAVARFTEFFRERLHPMQVKDESGLLTRLDLLLKKIILLLTANIKADEVPVEIVDIVIGMYPYLISAYSIPAAQLGNTQLEEVHQELLRHIQNLSAKGKPPSQRDLSLRVKRKKFPLDLVVKVLKLMTDMGEIEPVVTQGAGRPTVRYRYVG